MFNINIYLGLKYIYLRYPLVIRIPINQKLISHASLYKPLKYIFTKLLTIYKFRLFNMSD
jgi:hypothetical protein